MTRVRRAAHSRTARVAGLLALLVLLLLAAQLSLMVGAKPISPAVVFDALHHADPSTDHQIVRELRLPRTLLGLAAGAALGLAGTLMQALTRNPLADPGILGINAGAAAAVVAVISVFGVSAFSGYVWFAFAGAALAAVVVYALGSAGQGGVNPVRLALAGTAVAFACVAVTQAVITLDPEAFNEFRFWIVGSLAGRDAGTLVPLLPFLALGAMLALGLARALNALALGEDAGRALGAHVIRTRAISAVAVVLLCGAATAAVGPIAFLGLAVPHAARRLVGADHRWILPYAMVLAPLLLLVSDVIGRVVVSPSEVQVGIVTAFVGGPVFIALVSRRRIAAL
ncbi:iron chelate uptake ABC transporter family permease subunit [Actinopolymorpha sp. B11F2]|uniref:FecCD family ABC transporter permease n=1 Tax=Actinopolymorpha sp. B11F2 TaxID=3160862 RepID=UPI0032E46B7B